MYQKRFWSKSRKWEKSTRRPRKIELSERGIYEPVIREEDVLQQIYKMLWYSGIPVMRERERIPKVKCKSCGAEVFVGKPSDAGHSDLHGLIPAAKLPPPFRSKTPNAYAMPFFIEVKRPDGGIHSAVQQEFIVRMISYGAMAFFAHSWQDVRNEFYKRVGILLPEG